MGALDFLFVVAVIVIVLWLLGFVFNFGAIIWLLLVIAIIVIVVRLLSGHRI
jgi:low affinity Fe/Cu permease